jgi:tetratricopeptide (TPR) repeat protein
LEHRLNKKFLNVIIGNLIMKVFYLTFFVTILCAQNFNSVMQATAALNAGMYEDALVHIKEAEKEDPTSPEVYQMKALLHEALSQPKEALEAWKSCLKYSKDKKVKRQAKNHIKVLSYEL